MDFRELGGIGASEPVILPRGPRVCSYATGFAIPRLALATVNLPTEFDYEDMKGDTKCPKLGGLG